MDLVLFVFEIYSNYAKGLKVLTLKKFHSYERQPGWCLGREWSTQTQVPPNGEAVPVLNFSSHPPRTDLSD